MHKRIIRNFNLLKIEQLSFWQGDRCLIPPSQFTWPKGLIWAILGESGVGKSTFLHLLAGLINPTGGSISWNEKPVKPPKDKLVPGHPDIHLVRQNAGLFPNISLKENLRYALRFYESSFRQERMDYLLEKGGLTGIQNQLPREVSGGEQQRTAILMAMAEPPGVLLLDEPFSHLDARNKDVLRRLILDLVQEEETLVVFVTHDAHDALSTADQISILGPAGWTQTASPEVLYREPANVYVAGLTGRFYPIQGHIVRPEHVQRVGDGYRVIPTSSVFLGPYYLNEGVLETGERIGWYAQESITPDHVQFIRW